MQEISYFEEADESQLYLTLEKESLALQDKILIAVYILFRKLFKRYGYIKTV